jgi:octaprenyl-diphosphate synthase
MTNVLDAATNLSPAYAGSPVAHRIRRKIGEILATESPSLRTISSHPSLDGGKMLRSRLLIAAMAADDGAAIERCVNLGAVLELVHLATLFHDDVLDAAEIRRGKRTLCAEHGNKGAILGGDYLLSKALLHLSRTASLDAVRVVSQAVSDVFSGELLQHESSGRVDIAIDDYLYTISLKTGALFRAACELACLLGDERLMAALSAFGAHAGLLYQLIDDHNDYFSDPTVAGKPLGQDFISCVPTLPLILGLQTRSIAAELQSLFGNTPRSIEHFTRALQLLRSAGILQASSDFITDVANRAKQNLGVATDINGVLEWFDILQHTIAAQRT